MIKLIFDEEEIAKFKFHGQLVDLCFYNSNLFKFTFEHLVISERLCLRLKQFDNKEEYSSILLNILLNEGDRIPEVCMFRTKINLTTLCNLLINVIICLPAISN